MGMSIVSLCQVKYTYMQIKGIFLGYLNFTHAAPALICWTVSAE